MSILSLPQKGFLLACRPYFFTQPLDINFCIYYHSIEEAPEGLWLQLLQKEDLFFSKSYLLALEKNAVSIEFRYVIFWRDNKYLGFAYFQLVELGEKARLRFRTQKPSGVQLSLLGNIRKKLNGYVTNWINRLRSRVLICGNCFVTGKPAYVFDENLVAPSERASLIYKAIQNLAIQESNKKRPIEIFLVKDFDEEQKSRASHLRNYAFHSVRSEPNMVLAISWDTFDSYMQALKTKYRTRAKKLIQKSSDLYRKTLTLEELQTYERDIFTLYQSVCANVDLLLGQAAPTYFSAMKKRFPDHFFVFSYFKGEKMVAFISYFINGACLEAHFAGLDYAMNSTYGLYNNLLLDLIRIAIDNRLSFLSLGRTATEIKSTIGAEPLNQYAFLAHKNPLVHLFIPYLVNAHRNDSWNLRRPFKDLSETQKNYENKDDAKDVL
jgi:hypothetical protein